MQNRETRQEIKTEEEIYLLMSWDLICPNNSDMEEDSLNLLARFASTIMNVGWVGVAYTPSSSSIIKSVKSKTTVKWKTYPSGLPQWHSLSWSQVFLLQDQLPGLGIGISECTVRRSFLNNMRAASTANERNNAIIGRQPASTSRLNVRRRILRMGENSAGKTVGRRSVFTLILPA
jgi:hypothetical protein